MAKRAKPKPKSTPKVPTVKAEDEGSDNGPRRIRAGRYKSFQLQKRISDNQPEIRGAFSLMARAIKLVLRNWKLFGGITAIYLIFSAFFIQYSSLLSDGQSLGTTHALLQSSGTGGSGLVDTTGTLFLTMLGSIVRNNSSSSTGIQFLMTLLSSLAIIWALRQVFGGKKARIRDSFYKGMAPLVPFVLIMLVIGIELLPAVIGVYLDVTVNTNGIAASSLEKILWFGMMSILTVLSLYLITSSLMALYVVTLPDMTPIRALRSARKLVRYRRWTIMRKILFMPVSLVFLSVIVMMPFLILITKLSPIVFYALTAFVISVVHSYMYGLYRELLNEQQAE